MTAHHLELEEKVKQIAHSLEWYLCPRCYKQHSNFRWSNENGKLRVLGCSEACAQSLLKQKAKDKRLQ